MKTTITLSNNDVTDIIKEYIKGKTGITVKEGDIIFKIEAYSNDPREYNPTYKFKEVIIRNVDINKF